MLRRQARSGVLTLMYHRIIPDETLREGVQAGMYVKPCTFEGAQRRFLHTHFKIVPLQRLLAEGGPKNFLPRSSTGRPHCVLTFDDGWRDFYEHAYPTLKSHRIPATVFLPTDFIGTDKSFWTDRLTHLFFKKQRAEGRGQRAESKWQRVERKQSSSSPLINELENVRGSKESKLERAIHILKAYRHEEIEEILSELSRRWNINQDPSGRVFLSWEEVREMSSSGLITFGSHTAGHKILTGLQDDEIRSELCKSKERLIDENVVDPAFIPFSYPNGNYNESIMKLAREAGYSLAVTTQAGWNGADADLFALRRIGIHQDMTSTEAMLGCRIAGIF